MSTIDDQATEWVLRGLDRSLDTQERCEFEAWHGADIRHQGAYLRATAIQYGLRRLAAGTPAAPRWAPQGEPALAVVPGVRWSRRSLVALAGLAAGVAAMGLAFYWPHMPEHAEYRTAQGEFRKLPLPDQSIASINSASRIALHYTDDTRAVVLAEGEAWFDVAKNKSRPFIVEAGDVRARAVGTAFSVRRLAHGAEVLVTEGTVEVWAVHGAGEHRRVSAGESAFFSGGSELVSVSRQPKEVARKLAWREGKLVFVDQTLREAVADFNRYSTKKIVIADPALLERKFVGQYPVAAPEDFAHDVSAYLGVPLKISADQIVIGAAPGQQPAG